MTPTEKALLAAVSELYIVVNDIHYRLSEESRGAEEEDSEDLRKRADYLTLSEQMLRSVRHRLAELGSDSLN